MRHELWSRLMPICPDSMRAKPVFHKKMKHANYAFPCSKMCHFFLTDLYKQSDRDGSVQPPDLSQETLTLIGGLGARAKNTATVSAVSRQTGGRN